MTDTIVQAGPETFDALLQDCFAVLGKRGAGKSSLRQAIFQHELDQDHRTVLIDPKGDSWGIRLMPDGVTKSPYQIPIFGGRHGDHALAVDQGQALGKLIATHNVSCILDLSNFQLSEKQSFMLDFARALHFHNRVAITLLVDEADQLAPETGGGQRTGGITPQLVNAMGALVLEGRQRGIIMGMFTQRSQHFSKRLLSQVDSFVGMKVLSPRDRDTYKGWFENHSRDAAKLVVDEVAQLSIGQGYVYVSAENLFAKVQFPAPTTFDSGRTVRHGDDLADIKLERVTADAIIGALTVADSTKAAPADLTRGLTTPEAARRDEEVAQLQAALASSQARVKHLSARVNAYRDWAASVTYDVEQILSRKIPGIETEDAEQPDTGPVPAPPADPGQSPPAFKSAIPPGADGAGGGELLNKAAKDIAYLLAVQGPLSWDDACVMLGFRPGSGWIRKTRKILDEAGLLNEAGDGRLSTSYDIGPGPHGTRDARAVRDTWEQKLRGPGAKMVFWLGMHGAMTRSSLADGINMSATAGWFRKGVKDLIGSNLVTESGDMLVPNPLLVDS